MIRASQGMPVGPEALAGATCESLRASESAYVPLGTSLPHWDRFGAHFCHKVLIAPTRGVGAMTTPPEY